MTPARQALLELLCTVGLPLLILQFGTPWFGLGPVAVSVWAAVPAAGWVGAQIVRERTVSALGALALVGVALSGAVAVLQVDGGWFAWKEALLPVAIGVVTAATAATPWAVVGVLFDRILDPGAVARLREVPERGAAYAGAVRRATLELAASFAAPGLIAFGLARALVVSPGGTDAYVTELGRYTMWSFPMVTVPGVLLSVAVLRRAMGHVEAAAGVPFEELLPELE